MTGPSDESDEAGSWSDVAHEFTENTTIHGIRYAFEREAPSKIRRLLWLVLFLTATGFFLNQVVDRVVYYISRPVTVKMEVNFNSSLQFPNLLLCNQNSFRITRATELGYREMLDEFYAHDDGDPGRLAILEKYGYANLSMEELFNQTAHQASDLVVRCRLKNKACNASDFVPVMTDYGVCYSFGLKKHLLMEEAGTESSLTLYLNIEQYENMIGPHFAAGVKVLMLAQNDVPLLKGQGQGIAAGFHVFAGLRTSVMKRLPKPYGNCSDDIKLEYYDVYTERACYAECYTKFFTERAKCRLPYMKGDASVCSLYEYARWTKPIRVAFDEVDTTACKCPPPCNTLIFRPRFSYLRASDNDITKILDNSTRVGLKTKHVAARDILWQTNPRLKAEDYALLDNYDKYHSGVRNILWVKIPILLGSHFIRTSVLQRIYRDIFETVQTLYAFQIFVVKSNFYGFAKYNNDLYLMDISNGFAKFYKDFTDRLVQLNVNGSSAKMDRDLLAVTLYNLIRIKLESVDLSRDALLNCTKSYTQGTIGFENPYLYIHWWNDYFHYVYSLQDTLNIVPKERLRNIKTELNFDPIIGVNDTLHSLSAFYLGLNDTITDAHLTNLDSARLTEKWNVYSNLIGWYAGNRSALIGYYFREPLTSLEQYVAELEAIHTKVEDGFKKMYTLGKKIKAGWNRTVETSWNIFDTVYFPLMRYKTGRTTKMKAALSFDNSSLKDAKDMLYGYMGSLFNDVDSILGVVDSNYDELLEMLDKVYRDRGLKTYAQAQQPKPTVYEDMVHFKNTSAYVDIIREQTAYKEIWTNLTKKIQQVREAFNDAYGAVDEDMRNYIRRSEIDGTFYKDNFISLVVYFEEMNYEMIEQQEAYTIYSLLSDIGGSMGLFVGCSVISLVEIIDAIMYRQLYRRLKVRRKCAHRVEREFATISGTKEIGNGGNIG